MLLFYTAAKKGDMWWEKANKWKWVEHSNIQYNFSEGNNSTIKLNFDKCNYLSVILYSMGTVTFDNHAACTTESSSPFWPFTTVNTIIIFPCCNTIYTLHHACILFHSHKHRRKKKDLRQPGNNICISLNGVVRCCKSTALDLRHCC